MPSNKQLIKSISDTSGKLSKDVPVTEGLSNDDLVAVLKLLREELKIIELTESITVKAGELDVDVPDMEGKTIDELIAIIKEMTGNDFGKGDKSNRIVESNKSESDRVMTEQKKKFPYEMEKGKAVTTMVGVKSEGDEITAAMLSGGDDTLKNLVAKKYVKKN